MNKTTLIWTLIAAVPVGAAALATAYVYRDTGKLPFQESVETAPQTAGGVASAPAGDPAATSDNAAGPAVTREADVSKTPPAAPKGPSFDVVGVEPTGETVVAGRSEAGAIVALTANGKVVGKSIANEAGEWTIILDEPLKPGDYDVSLEVHDETGAPVARSDEHLAVSLPEGGQEQPLVVLNAPDRPSDILQKPEPETMAAEVPQPEPAADETMAAGASQPEPVSGGTVAGSSAPTQAAEPARETEVAALPSGTRPAASDDTATTAEDAQASATPAATGKETAAADPPSAGDAGAEPAAERDVAEEAPPNAGTGEARVDAVAEDSAAAGSEAPQPADTQQAVAVAAEEAVAGTVETADEPVQQAAVETAPGEAAPAETAVTAGAAPASGSVTVEAVESEKDKVFVAGTGNPGASVRVYVGDEFQGEAKVGAGGKWLVEGSKTIPEGDVEVRADLIGDDGNSVDARAAVTFEKERDQQIVLTKVVATGASGGAEGQGAEVKKSLPVVIIRKGDNLWRISRRLYGEGFRYTTIYQANQDQIRNPDLIYPGQVFLTPEGDLNWKPAPENNG
ncbi:MAG: hypothetical protein Tsb0019_28290 [Roseibium sp.]